MKKKKKKRFFSDFEWKVYKVCIFITILLVVLVVCSETSLAQVNVEVQKVEDAVMREVKALDSLEMKIDEMTSLDRIKEVSLEYGLSYNADNIKTIE